MLKNLKGKFILSSYPEEILLKYRAECGWQSKDIKQIVNVSGKRDGTKYKTECITYNFTPPNNQVGLFDAPMEESAEFIQERAERLLDEQDEQD